MEEFKLGSLSNFNDVKNLKDNYTVVDSDITTLQTDVSTLDTRLDLITYDTFPSTPVINAMPNNTIFVTRGFYTNTDGFGCTYKVTTTWTADSMVIGGRYVIPISQPVGELFLPYYGVRTGADYAANNNTAFSSIGYISFGSVLRFPSGHFYFNDPISISAKQLKIIGACPAGYTTDVNSTGMTWLHFPNLTNGQAGITSAQTSISNIVFYGNPSTYNLNIDRTKTGSTPNSIVTETNTATTYGVKMSTMAHIQDCMFLNFYYGIYAETGNIVLNNIFARKCGIVASIGNDTRVCGIYGTDVMYVLQIRGSISSAHIIRGDSVGKHLVHIVDGSNIYLSDLDADYCLESVLHIGNNTWTQINGLIVHGIHGRSNVYRAYDTTLASEPTVADITTSDHVEQYPIVSVADRTSVYSAKITFQGKGGSNPLDVSSNYRTPTILLAACANTTVNNTELNIISNLDFQDATPLNFSWLTNRIKTLSNYARNLEVSVKTAWDTLYYKQSGVSYFLKNSQLSMVKSSTPTSGEWIVGQEIKNSSPSAGEYLGWVCVSEGYANGTAWVASTPYTLNTMVNANDKVYKCTVAGTSGETPPSHSSSTATDGGVTWLYMGALAVFKGYGVIES